MVDVGDAVGGGHDAALERFRADGAGVVQDAVAHLGGKVEPPPVVLDALHHAQTLLVMPILGGYLGRRHIDAAVAGQASRQGGLARMAEGGMPQVMAERDGLRQVLVEPERAGYAARYLRNLKGMGEPRAEMIAFGGQEHLGFVRQAAEALAMQDLIAIALEFGSQEIRLARARTALGFVGLGRIRAQERMLAQLLVLAVNDVHGYPPDLHS